MRRLGWAAALAALAAAVVIATWPRDGAGAGARQLRGVMLHSLWGESPAAFIPRELDAARRLGASAVRVDVAWGSLEPNGKGSFANSYRSRLDRFMHEASRRGLKVVVVFHTTPCWASSAPSSVKRGCHGNWWARQVQAYPPANPRHLADAVGWLLRRHGNRMAALEVWNEPNVRDPEPRFLRSRDPAGAYVRLLRAAYGAAKRADRDVTVLAGALAFSDSDFLRTLYARGMRGHYDAISVHPYSEGRSPSAPPPGGRTRLAFRGGLEDIRRTMLAAGDRKPIWATEFGWTTAHGSSWRVDSATQARYLEEAVGILAGMPYVKGAFIYNLRNNGTDRSEFEDNFGLLRRNFTHRMSYEAVRRAFTRLR